MQITQVFAVRLAILVLATPVFLMFSLVAMVDGLVQRDLRRWGGGRESSYVYHWAKRSALPLLVLTWVIYLALPFSLHPSFVVLPCASLFALSVVVTASSFKKYLCNASKITSTPGMGSKKFNQLTSRVFFDSIAREHVLVDNEPLL
jgi:integrating conjugative element membrane protein (TIGR03747 family)